ncbi:unnamed protein product, partial [Linum tenue]
MQRRRHHEFIAVQPGDKDDHRLSRRGVRSLATAAAVSTAANRGGVETFFADEGVSWTALGLSDTISQALSSAGFNRQSLVQAESIPSILSGKDSIIAAETGSGKTHSYLVPLIHKLSASSGGAVSGSASDKGFKPSREVSLVLCPNVLLCEQVVRMANGLRDDNGDPLIKVAAVCGRQVVLQTKKDGQFINQTFLYLPQLPQRLVVVACLSLAAKVEETQVPLLLDLQ